MATSIEEEVSKFIEGDLEDASLDRLIEFILPSKKDSNPYLLPEVEGRLESLSDVLEKYQKSNNDQFNSLSNNDTSNRMVSLQQSMNRIQVDILRLGCDLAVAKKQLRIVESAALNPAVKERRELMETERDIRKSLRELKFDPLKTFFERFADYLSASSSTCKNLYRVQTFNFHQLFDWTRYHKAIFLLRSCGSAIKEINKFEELYQSCIEVKSIRFKRPIEQMDFNNFIEFHDTYRIDSQIEIDVPPEFLGHLNELMSDTSLKSRVPNPRDSVGQGILSSSLHRLRSITIELCKLLVDANMAYIDSLLTSGIIIDKLNGDDGNLGSDMFIDHTRPATRGFSPQDYATQIGQHLLTLRKQTEQFDHMENSSIKYSLEYLEVSQDIPIDVRSYNTVTEIVMRCIGRHCVRSLLGRTSMSILSKLNPNGKQQLVTDILYLDNVLEDLGLLNMGEPNVEKFKSLLALNGAR